jgi:peroxiredoxin
MLPGDGLLTAAALAVLLPGPVPDLGLPRADSVSVRLSEYSDGRPIVLVFLGVDCPLAGLYGPRLRELSGRLGAHGIRMLAVFPDPDDTLAAIATFARDHRLPFPCVADPGHRLADAVRASRTPEAFVLDVARRVRYRGRVDDQYQPGGADRGRPTREDLFEAAREVAAGQAVSVPLTAAVGCVIDRQRVARATPAVTYTRDIRPVLRDHCESCHRPGEIGPFPLQTYVDARRRGETIAEAVADGRMPPWHANPRHGRFRNDRSLSEHQKSLIAEWVRLGCPEGVPTALVPAPAGAGHWAIGTPDAIYSTPRFEVPDAGIIDYQHFHIDPGLMHDAWIRAVEVRPGNRRVVHHCNVFLQPPDSTDPAELYSIGPLRSRNLIAWAPGGGPVRFPLGMAKRFPAGFRLHFIVHYTPVGTPQTDRTELAVQFVSPAEVRQEVATQLLEDLELTIPPHAAQHRVEHVWRTDRDVVLLSLFPHMHLRGRSFRYEAEFPGGSREVLLDVPAFDTNWQHRYELVEPRRLAAGTTIRCTAVYDNSAENPANPDPKATVRAGEQITDEMFNAFFDIALVDQDLAAESAAKVAAAEREAAGRRRRTWLTVGCAVAAVAWAVRMRRK